MKPFNFYLGLFNGPVDQFIFNGLVLRKFEFGHNRANLLAAKNSHQIILQRKIKSRRTRIPLAARTAPELIVDTPRLVPFSAYNMKATGFNNFIVYFSPFLVLA